MTQSSRTNRGLLLLIGFVLIAAVLFILLAKPSDNMILNVLNWDFYIGQQTVPTFEKKTGAHVQYSLYASNEDALAKISAAPGTWDVVFPSDYMIEIMKKAGKLQPLDLEQLSNLVNIDPLYRKPPFDANEYCVPYLFGTTGFAVNRSFVSKAELPPEAVTWRNLKKDRFKDRIVVLDDMRFVLGSVLLELGLNPNTTNEEDLNKAVALLREVKPYILAFTADTGKDYLLNGEAWIAYAWNGDTLQVQATNPSVEYVIPEAGSLKFQDGVCLIANAPHPDLAHRFVNHILDAEVSAEITNYTKYGNTNAAARHHIDSSILENPASFPPEHVASRLRFVQDLGENVELFERAWERVKER